MNALSNEELSQRMLALLGNSLSTAFLLITDISKFDVHLSCIYAALSGDDGTITHKEFNSIRSSRKRRDALVEKINANLDRSPHLQHLKDCLVHGEPILEWRHTLAHGVLLVNEMGIPYVRNRIADRGRSITIPLIESNIVKLRSYTLKLITVVESTLVDLGARTYRFGELLIHVSHDEVTVGPTVCT